jgi:TPR repeat protein
MAMVMGLWIAPASAQYNEGSSQNAAPPPKQDKLQLNPYEQALRLKQQGDCAKAIDLLLPLAKSGHGYEVAQLNLGQCYLIMADKTADAETQRKDREDAVKWIVDAAEAGLAPAQEQLVRLTLQGGWVKIEPAEAGKWYLLWKRNPARTQLGVSDLDPKLQQKLKTMLSDADWAEANVRANKWHVIVQPGAGAVP